MFGHSWVAKNFEPHPFKGASRNPHEKKKRDAFGGGFHRLQVGISRDNRAYQPYMNCKSYM